MEYKKSKDGYHFYRIDGDDENNILHVFHSDDDKTIISEQKNVTMITEVKKDDCCINMVHGLKDNLIDCSKEEFDSKIKQVIFILGIYEFCELKK